MGEMPSLLIHYLGAERGQLVEHDNDRVQERHDLKMAALTNLE